MSASESSPAKKLAAKAIAVGAEGAASALFPMAGVAFAAGSGGLGLLILGCWAAFIAVKNDAQSASSDAQAGVEALLASLIAEHKSLRKAVDVLDAEHSVHEFVSNERVKELRKLLTQSSNEILNAALAIKKHCSSWLAL